jgi:hypothetical protein
MTASLPRRSRAQQPQRLSDLPAALKIAGYNCRDVSYRKIWIAAIEGRFPAQRINSHWYFSPGDTTAIGEALNLPRAEEPAAA